MRASVSIAAQKAATMDSSVFLKIFSFMALFTASSGVSGGAHRSLTGLSFIPDGKDRGENTKWGPKTKVDPGSSSHVRRNGRIVGPILNVFKGSSALSFAPRHDKVTHGLSVLEKANVIIGWLLLLLLLLLLL
jgi:hypothetical protein